MGEHLLLRPLREDDFDALYAAASDPLIWEQHPQRLRYQRDVFQNFFQEAVQSQGALVITDTRKEIIIGSSRYYDYHPETRDVIIGYTFLKRDYWGGTFNRELKRLMLDHAFQAVDTVYFHVGESNTRSRKAMEKIGGTLVKTLTRTHHDGTEQRDVIYVLRSTGRSF